MAERAMSKSQVTSTTISHMSSTERWGCFQSTPSASRLKAHTLVTVPIIAGV
jgi:hypothetical protein